MMEVLESPLLSSILELVRKESDVHTAVTTSLATLLTSDPINVRNTAITCSAGLLNLFCRLNWTGPPLSTQENKVLEGMSLFDEQSLEILTWDGEVPYQLCKQPVLLVLSHLILENTRELSSQESFPKECRGGDGSFDYSRWTVRCLFVQQRLLSQRSESLWNRISQLLKCDLLPVIKSGELSKVILCETNMELGHIYLFYSNYEAAQESFECAMQLSNIKAELTGSLGKRTKFQVKDVAQLLLQVTSTSEGQHPKESIVPNKCLLPQDLLLGDDTLLEQIKYTDQPAAPVLTSLQQAVILGECIFHQKSSAKQRLTAEEAEAYVRCVLAQPTCWVVQFQALFLRCILEQSRRRTVERAMMQLQVLVDCVGKEDQSGRLNLFYCLPLAPKWMVEHQLASVLVSLGSTRSALEVFERLQLWEDVIRCYQSIGRKGRAEEIVRDKLEQKETPTMWCLLGDITEDPQYYIKAWELSDHHSARAQRSLGLYYLKREQYEKSIESLQLSLQVNSLQESLWFSLGYAASQLGDNNLEIKAFKRSVTLEPDFAEAWNNLGAAYLKKKDKERAYRVYAEASKYGYGNWNIWENFLVVSTDVGGFDDSLRSYHRLIDLRDKYVDVGVLRILVSAVNGSVPDIQGNPASRLRKKLGELLGRICAHTTVGADVWSVYADFHFASDQLQDQEKGLIELQKAQRTVRLEQGWDRDEAKLQRVVEFTLKYSEACRRICCLREPDQSKQCMSSLSSAKLALQGVLTKTKAFGLTVSPSVQLLVDKMASEMKELLSAMENISDR